MSKYIKFDDAIDCECPLNEIWEDCIDCPLNDSEIEPCKMGKWLKSLPTIEVSEDNEPTWEQVKEYCFKRNFAIVGRETPKEYLRGFAEVSEDAISDEIWKPIPGYEGYYEASNLGRIRSVERVVKSGKGHRTVKSALLKIFLDEWGYEKVSISKDGKNVSRKVHTLVAKAFVPNPNNYPQVPANDVMKADRGHRNG